MDTLSAYKIDFKGIVSDTHVFDYVLDDSFFEAIDAPEVRKGNLKSEVTVKPTSGAFQVTFKTEGTIMVPCDRCLDDIAGDFDQRCRESEVWCRLSGRRRTHHHTRR